MCAPETNVPCIAVKSIQCPCLRAHSSQNLGVSRVTVAPLLITGAPLEWGHRLLGKAPSASGWAQMGVDGAECLTDSAQLGWWTQGVAWRGVGTHRPLAPVAVSDDGETSTAPS